MQGRGRSNSLPSHVVDYLKEWLLSDAHINHPYPTENEKKELCAATGLDVKRLNNWFVNSRGRIWKKEIEARQKQAMLQKQPQEKNSANCPNSVAKLTESFPFRCSQTSSEEGSVQAIKTISGSKTKVFTVPGRVSIEPLSPTGLLIHQVSDASRNINNDGQSSLSSSSSIGGDSQLSPMRTQLLVAEFYGSPPRPRKRPRFISLDASFHTSSSPPKFIGKNPDEWKEACLRTPHLDVHSLPTLDEAAFLFGYSVVDSEI